MGTPTIQRLCAWSGVAALVLMAIGFWPLAHMVPPPSPHWSAQHTAQFFADHQTGIRFGMIICMVASALLMPLAVAITLQMRRIEGRHSALGYIQLGLGAIFVLEFIYLLFFWQVATFRTDRAPEIVETLNDMAWVPYVGLSATFILQVFVFGVAVLLDKRHKPIFPRWFGYYQLWFSLMLTPGTFNVFFKTGPLAWNGLIAFYLPICCFVAWLTLTPIYLNKAVDHQIAEEDGAPARDLEAEVACLRADLDRLERRAGAVVGS